MNYFILMVLHRPERLGDVLTAWEEAGAPGMTVMASTGMGRIRHKTALREDMPLMPSLEDLLAGEPEELYNRTIFSIIEGEAVVDRIIAATERVLGDLSKPRNGIIAVFPLARVVGLRHRVAGEDENIID